MFEERNEEQKLYKNLKLTLNNDIEVKEYQILPIHK